MTAYLHTVAGPHCRRWEHPLWMTTVDNEDPATVIPGTQPYRKVIIRSDHPDGITELIMRTAMNDYFVNNFVLRQVMVNLLLL
jgi:hypothetical protein